MIIIHRSAEHTARVVAKKEQTASIFFVIEMCFIITYCTALITPFFGWLLCLFMRRF